MEYYFNFIWEKNGREVNEDSLCFKQIDKDGTMYLLAVICDGIGGLAQGETASSYVADCMGREFIRLLEGKRKPGKRQMRNALLRQIYKCHKNLKLYGQKKAIRLGTTISMVVICERSGYSFHVGDSGIFKGKNRLRRITGTHHTKGGALRQAVGVGKTPKVEQRNIRMLKNNVILLCSDGFYRMTEKEITGRMEWYKNPGKETKEFQEYIGNRLRAVYGNAVRKGERDNASAVCLVCR